MDTWWSTFVLWVLAVLAVCGVLSPLASHRLRAVDRWRERRLTYGVGLIRAADRSGGIRVAYPPLVEGVPASAVSVFATEKLELRT